MIEKIIDYKLKIDKIKSEKKEYDLITEITYNLENNEKIFKLYQKIDIKLWVFLNYENIFDKLKIEILAKNIV